MELYFTNRVLSAREALEWGLVTRVVPDAELASVRRGAGPRAGRRGRRRPSAAAKRLFHQSTWESLETQMELEAQAIAASGHAPTTSRNGVTAFARKQTPTFAGTVTEPIDGLWSARLQSLTTIPSGDSHGQHDRRG